MAIPRTQAEQRRDLVLMDQFGRRWLVCIEVSTGDPTGAITRAGNWRDPLRTPQAFITVPSADRMLGQWRVEIEARNWIDQQERAEVEWRLQLHKNARDQYKRQNPEDIPDLENDAYIRDLTGPKPWPSSAVLKAAMAGDRQYLGFEPLDEAHRRALGLPNLVRSAPIGEPEPTELVAPSAGVSLPPDTYKEFVPWALQTQGVKNLAEVGRLWREHQQALQQA